MIKFWKEDFRYINRYEIFRGYSYTFSVCGESANYLINKYELNYSNIQVHFFTCDNTMTVTSKTDDKLRSDVADIEEEDLKELLTILQEEVDLDLRNYENYICNDKR